MIGVREVADLQRLAQRRPAAEQLLLGVAAEERHAARLRLVLPVRVAPLGDRDAADLLRTAAASP